MSKTSEVVFATLRWRDGCWRLLYRIDSGRVVIADLRPRDLWAYARRGEMAELVKAFQVLGKG